MPKPKLTPEEKKLLKKQRKEEKKRAATAKKRQLKIDQLDREIKYGEATVEKREKQWKSMLMQISSASMRAELEFAWHNFDRSIDAKNFTIDALMAEIRDAEAQYIQKIRGHAENIDRLLGIFDERTAELRHDYATQIAQLTDVATALNDRLGAESKDSEQHFKTMIAGLKEAKEQFNESTMGDYIARLNEEDERYQDATALMRTILQMRVDNMWSDVEAFIVDERKRVRDRLRGHDAYDAADRQMHRLIDEQNVRIRRSRGELRRLKLTLDELVRTETSRGDELLKEREFYANRFYALKVQLRRESRDDDKRLTLMSIEGNAAIEYLKTIERKGADILTIASVCAKYETEMEKVLPFPVTKPTSITYNLDDVEKAYGIGLEDLRVFWQRVAQADAVRYAMHEELACLKRRNRLLRERIHDYCRCFNCPPLIDAVDGDEARGDGASAGAIVVDAAQEMKKYAAKERRRPDS